MSVMLAGAANFDYFFWSGDNQAGQIGKGGVS